MKKCEARHDGATRGTVKVCEAVLRDGIQNWPSSSPPADKISLVQAIVAAGFTELDVTSFVPAAVVPQFADATDVLPRYRRHQGGFLP